jgi:CubicO group peptidase (beta-lactamase class C family)
MNTGELGFVSKGLEQLTAVIENDIAQERYDGAVAIVARNGKVALHQALGFADRANARPARIEDVFYLFSVTKTLTAATGGLFYRGTRNEDTQH